MTQHDPRLLSMVILLANVGTAAVTVTATIRRPILSYKIIPAIAVWAVIASLQQVVSNQLNLTSFVLNSVLVLSIACRAVLNQRRPRNRERSRH